MTTNEKLYEMLMKAKDNAIDLQKLEEALIENIREETAKATGKKNTLKAVKSVVADSKSMSDRLIGYHEIKGKYAFTDGHRIIISESNFGYDKAEQQLDFEKMLEADTDIHFSVDIADVKAFYKMHKKNPAPYILEIGKNIRVGLNPRYIIDAYTFSGSTEFYVASPRGNIIKTPIVQYDENGNIITLTLPVCIK